MLCLHAPLRNRSAKPKSRIIMSGIVGIIDARSRRQNRRELDLMVACILHESFYTSGTFVNEQLGLSVGWAAHPGSFSDCMPVWNEEKSICLIFNGEDYQDRSRIDRLRTEGHQFSGQNASYVVHLYEELGLKFLESVNG